MYEKQYHPIRGVQYVCIALAISNVSQFPGF